MSQAAFPTAPSSEALERGAVLAPRFDASGLVAAVATHAETGEVLMLAWMNAEALAKTVETREAHYWSRSRRALWKKGETSGQVQKLIDCRVDCDRDCLLLLVDQIGVACHTGRRSCFYTALRDGKAEIIADVEIDPDKLYGA